LGLLLQENWKTVMKQVLNTFSDMYHFFIAYSYETSGNNPFIIFFYFILLSKKQKNNR
jgi:hypothetical protein